jgi:hypothetical protein
MNTQNTRAYASVTKPLDSRLIEQAQSLVDFMQEDPEAIEGLFASGIGDDRRSALYIAVINQAAINHISPETMVDILVNNKDGKILRGDVITAFLSLVSSPGVAGGEFLTVKQARRLVNEGVFTIENVDPRFVISNNLTGATNPLIVADLVSVMYHDGASKEVRDRVWGNRHLEPVALGLAQVIVNGRLKCEEIAQLAAHPSPAVREAVVSSLTRYVSIRMNPENGSILASLSSDEHPAVAGKVVESLMEGLCSYERLLSEQNPGRVLSLREVKEDEYHIVCVDYRNLMAIIHRSDKAQVEKLVPPEVLEKWSMLATLESEETILAGDDLPSEANGKPKVR